MLPHFTCPILTAQVPKDAGPKDEDPSSVHYPYFSNVNYVTDEYNGLIGVVMIARQGTLTAEGALRFGSTAAHSVVETRLHILFATPACIPHVQHHIHGR